MKIDSIYKKKYEMESKILHIIRDFTSQTGLVVSGVDIGYSNMQTMSDLVKVITIYSKVSTDVKL